MTKHLSFVFFFLLKLSPMVVQNMSNQLTQPSFLTRTLNLNANFNLMAFLSTWVEQTNKLCKQLDHLFVRSCELKIELCVFCFGIPTICMIAVVKQF